MSDLSEIKDKYKTILDAKKFLKKRIDTIMSNTAYIDYEMIRKDQEMTQSSIERVEESIEETYKKVNPELAALREKERKGEITTEQRRKEVTRYYNNKQSKIDR